MPARSRSGPNRARGSSSGRRGGASAPHYLALLERVLVAEVRDDDLLLLRHVPAQGGEPVEDARAQADAVLVLAAEALDERLLRGLVGDVDELLDGVVAH